MNLTVRPVRQLRGSIDLPASKSYSIRAFMTAACGGNSFIKRPSDCDDAKVAISAARALGAKLTRLDEETWSVKAGENPQQPAAIHIKESGTVLRLILPLLAMKGCPVRVTGEGTLIGRPNHHLLCVLRAHGVRMRGTGPRESVPINLVSGRFRGGRIEIDGTLSSQFISALLMTCPQLPVDSRIRLTGRRLVSTDYIQMTEQMLALSGIRIRRMHERLYHIPGNQRFHGLSRFCVPSDYGLAAFPLAAAALLPSRLTLKGYLADTFIQADGRILEFLTRMGVSFVKTSRSIKIRGPFDLKGGRFSLKDCPDLLPIMAVLALFARGRTRLCDIGHARVKESDRISDLRGELLKVGARVTESAEDMIIDPLPWDPQKGCPYQSHVLLDPHHDHRLAMAFFVFGLKSGVRIKDMECVRKSYPGFVKDMTHLGVSASFLV
jgi:3-phosphoshikimate 1-carboxyvinyltransferase